MDSAFVTGGTGFVGANLVRLLLEKGFRVKTLVRPKADQRNLEGQAVEIIEGDLLDKKALRAGCSVSRYVFHVAADYRLWVSNPDDMYATNVDGTLNMINAAGKAGVERIVHCSSVSTIKPSKNRLPADESSEYGGVEEIVSHYKKSKFLSEKAAVALAASGLPVVIVNPSAPIGPYDVKPTPTGKMVVDFLNGRMPSYIDTGLNVVNVRDAAMGHYLAAVKGRCGQRYILGGENMTLKQLLNVLADAAGLPAPSFKTPYALAYLFGALDTARARCFGGEPLVPLDAVKMAKYYMWFNSRKAEQELGYRPTSARAALAEAVAWFTANGYAKARMAAAV